MKKAYMTGLGKIVKQCPGLHEYWYHSTRIAYGSGISCANPDVAPDDDDWALCARLLAEYMEEREDDDEANPPYDRETFEDMIFDFVGDHAGDEDWPGEELEYQYEYPVIFEPSIYYDPDDNTWAAYAHFESSGVWVEFIGDEDGYITMEGEDDTY